MDVVADPKSVKVNVTTGTGMDIEWKDGHQQLVSASRSCAMPAPVRCAMKSASSDGRQPGDPLKPVAGALPMFKAAARPTEVEPVGKYAIRFIGTTATSTASIPGSICASIAPAPSARRGAPWKRR